MTLKDSKEQTNSHVSGREEGQGPASSSAEFPCNLPSSAGHAVNCRRHGDCSNERQQHYSDMEEKNNADFYTQSG